MFKSQQLCSVSEVGKGWRTNMDIKRATGQLPRWFLCFAELLVILFVPPKPSTTVRDRNLRQAHAPPPARNESRDVIDHVIIRFPNYYRCSIGTESLFPVVFQIFRPNTVMLRNEHTIPPHGGNN